MKITTMGGVVTAQAETVEDVKTLLNLGKKKEPRVAKVKRRWRKKTPCSICGKRYKGMKRHIILAHTQPSTLAVQMPSEFLV